jgi:antitoxin FitA
LRAVADLTVKFASNQNGFNPEPSMPTTLTLKNIPDAVYARLKASAEAHRRSLNSEAIVCLEAVLLPSRVDATERLARARALREQLGSQRFAAADIDAAKREGRP